jgi:hypothetical protein
MSYPVFRGQAQFMARLQEDSVQWCLGRLGEECDCSVRADSEVVAQAARISHPAA